MRSDERLAPSRRLGATQAVSVRIAAIAAASAVMACATLSPKPAAGQEVEPVAGATESVAATTAAATNVAQNRCSSWEATYAVSASLRITDTPMGAGDGTHPIGPGTLVLRVDERSGHAELVSFDLHEHFAVKPSAVMWNATVVTDASMRATPDASGAAASGTWSDGQLRWATPVRGYHSEGALTCDGSLCGKFGAPPPGRSDLQAPTIPVRFQPFHFERGGETFQMPYTLVSEAQSPKQRTYLALAGRRTRWVCSPSGHP